MLFRNLISDDKPKEMPVNLDSTGLEGEKTPEALNRKLPKNSTKSSHYFSNKIFFNFIFIIILLNKFRIRGRLERRFKK